MPLLRSTLSNPAESAIRAFETVSDTLERREAAPLKRELMAQEIADKKLRREREEEDIKWNEQYRARMKKQYALEDQLQLDHKNMGYLSSAVDKFKSGKSAVDLDENEIDAVLMSSNTWANWKDLPPDKWADMHKDLKTLKEGMKQHGPQIMTAMENGGKLEKKQAPEIFDAMNRTEAFGGSGTNFSAMYFKGGNVVFEKEEKDDNGNTKYVPVRVPGDDPNRPVLQIPVQLLGATINSQADAADWLEQIMMQKGNKEVGERRAKLKENQNQMRVLIAGQRAVDPILERNPNENVNVIRNAYKKAAQELAEKEKIAVDPKVLSKEADDYVASRVPQKKLTNEADLAERSTEVDEKGKPTPSAIRAEEALKKLTEAKRGEKNPPAPPRRTLMDLRVIAQGKGEESEAAKKAIKEHEAFELNKEKTKADESRKTKEGGKERGLTPVQIRAEKDKVSSIIVKEFRKGDKNIEVEADLDLEPEEKEKLEDVRSKMFKLIDEGKSAEEAKDLALKESKVSKLKPIDDATRKSVKKKFPPTTPVKEVEKYLKSQGFNPETW